MAYRATTNATTVTIDTSTLPGMILSEVVDEHRRGGLLKSESYYRCTQYRHRPYYFDGSLAAFGAHQDVHSDDIIPMRHRQPSLRLDLPAIIVNRLTAMLFGHNRFPLLSVEGDPLSEDFVRELAKEAKLAVKMHEARNIGGSCGSVALSWGFVEGRPVVEVHQAALMEVLEWADYERRRPGKVLKAYKYKKRVRDLEGRMVKKEFWYARYWDAKVDITIPQIELEHAETVLWRTAAKQKVVRHDCGFCPVYWVQNLPDSSSVDGLSDYEGQEDCFAQGDLLYSATAQGTIVNVDPTLVIRDDPKKNEGVLRKGSQHALYCKGGAEYLEIKGSAVEAGTQLLNIVRRNELDVASVVVPDPDKLSALGLSGKAIEMLYQPMLSKCDLLREMYGCTMVEMLRDMVTVAQRLRSEPRQGEEGELYWARVVLDPKIEETEQGTMERERAPGRSARVVLVWPPYFPDTWKDRGEAIKAVKEGTGGQQVISQKTAVSAISTMMGVEDVDAELERIEEDKEGNLERAQRAFEGGAPRVTSREETDGGESARDQESEGGGSEET